jgi:hypothetical protein
MVEGGKRQVKRQFDKAGDEERKKKRFKSKYAKYASPTTKKGPRPFAMIRNSLSLSPLLPLLIPCFYNANSPPTTAAMHATETPTTPP